MAASIRFLLGREVQEVSGFDPQMTVLEWLRTRAHRTGTKEGCAEGDCGACTIALGELHEGAIRYRAFNSCIQLLPTLDGRQLLTVEDLAGQEGPAAQPKLHPVQQAMVDQHGSQCGFCTPGFVMSLFTLFHQDRVTTSTSGKPAEKQRIDQAIAGNLCRCTGYAPIVRAAQQALATAPDDDFHQTEKDTVTTLQKLQTHHMQELAYKGRRYFSPRSFAELWPLLEEFPEARMVAGATDVGLWITKHLRQFETLINLCEVRELQVMKRVEEQNALHIGGAVRYTDALQVLSDLYPGMRNMLLRLGAEQVRNAGTIGGNIANGSPIGDMPPALIALGATLLLHGAQGSREIALEDFFVAYGQQDLRHGECVEGVRIPLLEPGQHFAVYKISKRFDQDISGLCAGLMVRLANESVAEARICFGGMAGTPLRAKAAEQALLNQPWNETSILRAQQAIAGDYTPLTDWRASSEYRMLAAQNLLMRFFLETTSSVPVQVASVQVASERGA